MSISSPPPKRTTPGCTDDPDDVKRAFARDLDNLTLAAPTLNRNEKSDKDPTDWIPENNRCWYVGKYVEIKRKYGLSMDQSEANAILEIYEDCASFDMVIPECN